MSSAGSDLKRAIEAFRRGQALNYLDQVAHRPAERIPARRWLLSEQASARFEEVSQSGEIAGNELSALGAHMARAALEEHYERARLATPKLVLRSVSYEGETRRVGQLLGQWSVGRTAGHRHALARSLDGELKVYAREILGARREADEHAGQLLARLRPGRHPDAGPEGGNAALAEQWLELTKDLTQEALGFARRELRLEEGHDGLENLWCALGTPLSGLFPRPGRLRRLASEWEPLGLRRLLRAHVRLAPEHPSVFPSPHVVPLAAPRDIRLSPSAFELGLASELATADSLARAMAAAHASTALPFALRHAPVGTVARAVGQLGMLLFTDPLFLRKARGLNQRESHSVARLATAYALIDTRLQAASVLARNIRADSDLERIGALSGRALLGSVPTGWGACLVLRLSPGGAMRGKSWAPALSYVLRERFDVDWFVNPRAKDPVRGAMVRAGELAIETWATEMSAQIEQGPKRLAELF